MATRLSNSTHLIFFPCQDLSEKITLYSTYLANLKSILCPLVAAKTPFLDNAAFWPVVKVGVGSAKQTSYLAPSEESIRTAR